MKSWSKSLVVLLVLGMLATAVVPAIAAGLTGAIYTTNATCGGVNVNLFNSKQDVYLDGGPAGNGSGLPDGFYSLQVTAPGGTVLGTSVGSAAPAPIKVVGGKFSQCYKIWDIVYNGVNQGYLDTTNAGGEYKVWVSQDITFPESLSKTDNFKVLPNVTANRLKVLKFYDANANGLDDDGMYITGWKLHIYDNIDWIRWTPVDIQLAPDNYTVDEFKPVETNWMPTTPTSVDVVLPPDATVKFGNLCLGGGGGLTLGFWSNKNGQKLFGADDLALMVSLNLRDAKGSAFNPASYTVFRNWLLSAKATNMAYMLSAQLAAMELNVLNGKVSGDALIYAPGATSANSLGFATVNAVMAEANAELGLHGATAAGSPYRDYQEALKNALDNANNNMTFVQAQPCPFSFGD